MEVRLASEATPDRLVNEDGVLVVGGLVGVFDGVTQPEGLDSGCTHGPAWYVRNLCAALSHAYATNPTDPLPQLLATAIERVRSQHTSCDLRHPGTPAATTCLVKHTGSEIEYLVLCDSPLVLDRGTHVDVVTDERFGNAIADVREAALVPGTFGTADHAARLRWAAEERLRYTNRPGGYWIAAAEPLAAFEAVTGAAPLHGPDRIRRAALLTDGASAAVEQLGLVNWPGLLDVLTIEGPAELIRRVRAAELADSDGYARPRYKRHDDATAVLCLFEQE
jgi:hypothetical protein